MQVQVGEATKLAWKLRALVAPDLMVEEPTLPELEVEPLAQLMVVRVLLWW